MDRFNVLTNQTDKKLMNSSFKYLIFTVFFIGFTPHSIAQIGTTIDTIDGPNDTFDPVAEMKIIKKEIREFEVAFANDLKRCPKTQSLRSSILRLARFDDIYQQLLKIDLSERKFESPDSQVCGSKSKCHAINNKTVACVFSPGSNSTDALRKIIESPVYEYVIKKNYRTFKTDADVDQSKQFFEDLLGPKPRK